MIAATENLEVVARYAPAVEVWVAGAAIDPQIVLADVTVRSGRALASDGIEPATATVTLLTANPGGVGLVVGVSLVVRVDGAPRFTGRVAEVTRAGVSGSVAETFVVIGAGNLARLERLFTAVPLPAQDAATRIRSLLTAAGFTVTTTGGDTINLAAYGQIGDPPAQLSAVLGTLMTDTAAVLQDQPDGTILAQFPESRVSESTFTPDPAQTHVDLSWAQSDDLVNDCAVAWSGGEATAQDAASIAAYDPHTLRLTTSLADQGQAQRRANSLVARLATPVWSCGDCQTWDPRILDYTVGAVVVIAPLPANSPVGGSWRGVLEGWTDHYSPATDGSGQMAAVWDLALSDPRIASEVLMWMGVDPPSTRWVDVDPATAWNEAYSNADLTP